MPVRISDGKGKRRVTWWSCEQNHVTKRGIKVRMTARKMNSAVFGLYQYRRALLMDGPRKTALVVGYGSRIVIYCEIIVVCEALLCTCNALHVSRALLAL